MIAWATMISPPAPNPCNPRQRMSCSIVVEKPARMLPSTNRPIPDWNTIFLPNRSPSLPKSGVAMVCARRYAVMTHES